MVTSSGFRQILDLFTVPNQIIAPDPVASRTLQEAEYVLSEQGQKLPGDYREFLTEVNGFTWNGIDMFGVPPTRSDIHLLNAQSTIDPARRIGSDKLMIGTSESYVYLHDGSTNTYHLAIRPKFVLEATAWPSFSSLLVDIFTQRQGVPRPGPAGGPVLGFN